MIKFPVHDLKGEKVKDIELSEKIFGLERNDALLHQVYVSQYANRRRVLAHVKDRAERAGSGRKHWRQKGTGRARVGSVRSPIWRKGGVVFGPTKDRSFKRDIPKKMNRKALAIALSGKVKDKEIVVVDSLKMKEIKTRLMKQAVDNLKLKGSVLLGLSKDERLTKRAVRNLPKIDSVDAQNLNVFDILNHKYLVLSEEGVKILKKKYEHSRQV